MRKELITNDNIIVQAVSTKEIKDLVRWLETRRTVNITIVVQSIGNVINSHLDNVNILRVAP